MNDPMFHPAGETETRALVAFAGPGGCQHTGREVHPGCPRSPQSQQGVVKVTRAAADIEQRCALDALLANPPDELPLGPLETEQAEAQPVKAGEAGEEAARIGIDCGAAVHPKRSSWTLPWVS